VVAHDGTGWSDAIAVLLSALETSSRCSGLAVASPVQRVATLYGLSPFERDVLFVAAAAEIDGRVALACSSDDPARGGHVTVGFLLRYLEAAHLSAFAPTAPLRRHALVEVGGGPLVTAEMRLDERVLYELLGVETLDARLLPVVPMASPADLPSSHQLLAQRLAGNWAAGASERTLVQLTGADPHARASVAAAGWAARGKTCVIRAGDLAQHLDRDLLSRLLEREHVFTTLGVIVEIRDDDPPEVLRSAAAFVERTGAVIAVSAREPLRLTTPSVRIQVARPSLAERREGWRELVRRRSIEPLSDRFATYFNPDRHASAALQFAVNEGGEHLESRLWNICCSQQRAELEQLAERIEPSATWDDLVVPIPRIDVLREIANQVRQRTRVHDDWGFRQGRGLGVTALFAGPSGTGKTMAAEVIANELKVDLYRIDLSQVVSKYIGETEKNLRRVFDAAEDATAVLLFDEADALFGKRSDVKDSHDRYANIEVSYLLQRMESYRGLAILTTNAQASLDHAFLRRLRFVIHFGFPDVAERQELWRRAFPATVPTEGLRADRLAQLRLTGGNVRTIALNAAFIAASRDEPVSPRHILQAASYEYEKLGMPLAELHPLKS
jgi:hypothetical protein